MKKSANFYFLVVVIVVMSWVVVTSIGFKRLEARLMPLMTSVATILLALGGLAVESRKGRKQTAEEEQGGIWSPDQARKFALFIGWVLGFLLAIYLLGFMTAIALAVLVYLKMQGRPWRTIITFTVLFTLCIYLVFELALRSDLYKGLLYTEVISDYIS